MTMHQHPINIELTEHVCERYIERFNPQLMAITNVNERLNRAKIAIISILREAHYVADNEKGIVLHSPVHKCNLIVLNRRLITLYRPDWRKKSMQSAVGSPAKRDFTSFNRQRR